MLQGAFSKDLLHFSGNAKVFLLSFFKLVPDVRPAFILIDDSGSIPANEIDQLRKKVMTNLVKVDLSGSVRFLHIQEPFLHG